MSSEYPYLPEGREILFVEEDHPWMQEAKKVQETQAGDTIFPVGVVLVRDGKIIGRGGNGYNRGSQIPHICPRVVQNCASGEGYDLCTLHGSEGHAERMAIADAKEAGEEIAGADVYLYGHWWCCEPCWDAMIEEGVVNVYLLKGAKEQFSRENVFARTLQPTVKTAYIAGALTNIPKDAARAQRLFYEKLGEACEELGVEAYIPHLSMILPDGSQKTREAVFREGRKNAREQDVIIAEVTYPSLGAGCEIAYAHDEGKRIVLMSHTSAKVSYFLKGNPDVSYHIKYETFDEAAEKLKRVLQQL